MHESLKDRKKILITGGAGFLGSHLCERLLNDGCSIVCVDNLYCSSRQNIAHLMPNPNFKFINHDVIFPLDVEVEEIYNLACPASPIHYQRDPIQTTKTSILGAINLLELANKNNAKIFQASTSEVYGDPVEHPQKESYWGNVNPIGIRACYDEGKRCAESLFFDYWRKHNTSIKVGRLFNTYGPRMQPDDGRVVSNFILQALQNKPITIYGDGNQTRSFCYVDDMIDVITKFMSSSDEVNEPINLGNPNEFSIKELAENIIKITNSTSKIVFKQLPKDDPKQRQPDISIAKSLLNWEPKIELRTGLVKTINFFEKQL